MLERESVVNKVDALNRGSLAKWKLGILGMVYPRFMEKIDSVPDFTYSSIMSIKWDSNKLRAQKNHWPPILCLK